MPTGRNVKVNCYEKDRKTCIIRFIDYSFKCIYAHIM